MPAFLRIKVAENMAVPSVYLEIDASELTSEIDRLRSILKPERFDQVMYSIFKRTGNHVKMILRKDLPVDYHVKAGQINSAVKTPQLSGGGGMGVGCVIPIVDSRDGTEPAAARTDGPACAGNTGSRAGLSRPGPAPCRARWAATAGSRRSATWAAAWAD